MVVVRKEGERMKSEFPWRRELRIYLTANIDEAIDELQKLSNSKVEGEPWWKVTECKHCTLRREYEKSNKEAWQRGYCMRHYLIEHLHDLVKYFVYDNKPSRLESWENEIFFKVSSCNYEYNVLVTKDHALLRCDYKDSVYVFEYKNHDNALPHLSSYQYIKNAIAEAAKRFLAVLLMAKDYVSTCYKLKVVTPCRKIEVPVREEVDPR